MKQGDPLDRGPDAFLGRKGSVGNERGRREDLFPLPSARRGGTVRNLDGPATRAEFVDPIVTASTQINILNPPDPLPKQLSPGSIRHRSPELPSPSHELFRKLRGSSFPIRTQLCASFPCGGG
jgi:hypothetical protein